MSAGLLRATLDALSPDEQRRVLRDEKIRRHRARKNVEPFAAYERDLPGFARTELRAMVWSRQEEVLRSIVDHQITVVSTAQKVGKTRTAAFGSWGWVATRPRGQVVMTSGNADQLKLQLWGELKKVNEASGIAERLGVNVPDNPETGIHFSDGRFIVGVQPKDKVRLAGYSGDQTLFIVDEGSAFEDEMWEAILGNLLGGAHALVLLNPTKNSGFAFEYRTVRKGEANVIVVAATETPNYIENRSVIPGLAGREAVDKLIAAYGLEHPIVQVRALGQYASASSKGVVRLGDLEAAVKRWTPALWGSAAGRLAIGVDVARFGDDDSVIQPVRGVVGGPSVAVHGMDTVDVAGKTLQMAQTLRRQDRVLEKPIVVVDTSGVGAGVADTLRRCPEIELFEADSAANANERAKHHRLRDEMWWITRDWMVEGALPPDSLRDQELLVAEYGFDGEMRTLVTPKDEMKKRLKPQRSPDRADALCLAIARPQRGRVVPFRHSF